MIYSIINPIVMNISSAVGVKYAPYFDGLTQFAFLANRAIDPNGNNSFEFWTPEDFSDFMTIISQTDRSSLSSREFQIYTAASGLLYVVRGGNKGLFSYSVSPSTKYGLSQVGNTISLFEGGLSGALLDTMTVTDSGAREPGAITRIGARGDEFGSVKVLYRGLLTEIKINNTNWTLNKRNSPTQTSTPTGNDMEIVNHTEAMWREI